MKSAHSPAIKWLKEKIHFMAFDLKRSLFDKKTDKKGKNASRVSTSKSIDDSKRRKRKISHLNLKKRRNHPYHSNPKSHQSKAYASRRKMVRGHLPLRMKNYRKNGRIYRQRIYKNM